MSIILEKVIIQDKTSPYLGEEVDILVHEGVIQQISKASITDKADHRLNLVGCEAYPGFMDARVHSGVPGFEQKEDWGTLSAAAHHGGITSIAVLPDVEPITQSTPDIEYLQNKGEKQRLSVFPFAALTRDFDGVNFTDLRDLNQNGALGFTDVEPIGQLRTLELALEYTRSFGGIVVDVPVEMSLAKDKIVGEGVNATRLGMAGIPAQAEQIRIERGLSLLEYAGGRLHFSLITTGKGVELIQEAKKKGLEVTCDTALHYLYFDDRVLEEFNSDHKVFPPLRTVQDVEALKKAIKNKVIDFVVSNHNPQNTEVKDLEFDRAAYGISGLETLVPGLGSLGVDLYDALVAGPRTTFKLNIPTLKEGTAADISIISPGHKITWDKRMMKSKSRNTPFEGITFGMSVKGIVKDNYTNIETA